ncbi:hypothetical protein EJB05_00966, partial [Eragrostis curvula]
MPSNSALVVLLLPGVLLLLAAHASPVAASDSFGDGARTATVHLARTTTAATWQRRRLEEEVAPEFPSAAVGGPPGNGLGYQTLDPNNPVCVKGCAGKGPGDSYTQQKRKCYIIDNCRQP